ncbi:MAG: tRNA (N6-isopentenyl adenosine(37)-C2)-methylthiotransferase MiaB [Anaerolineales bacterium]|jgi:tRNA-2-methylthio-N6-dimethylallyladenosine synthase
MKYHIWTEGCQMNVADSQRVAWALEQLGYQSVGNPEQADVIVLNTCVVRQSAEDKAYGRLTSLRPLKQRRPDLVINVMGCLVGIRGNQFLQETFPYVDVVSGPSDPRPLLKFLSEREDGRALAQAETEARFARQDDFSLHPPGFLLPEAERASAVCVYVPIVYGCSHGCTFCVIPMRRGQERSRPVGEVVSEVRALAGEGVKEVTLLGQIVDRYGRDLPGEPGLPGLLEQLHRTEGLDRIRFLTSHPSWVTDELLHSVAEHPKVCEHLEVPVQAGDDEVLARMRRGYTAQDYRRLIDRIRTVLPGASIATDVIVGFPGETDSQFQKTYDLLRDLRLDVAHLAPYSPRPGTLAARRYPDDVPPEEKIRRFRALEELQAGIGAELNQRYVGQTLEILVEGKHKGRWVGRTRTNRLVFYDSPSRDWRGQRVPVRITQSTAWSLQGEPPALSP